VRGERFVIVHRWGRWNNAAGILRALPSAIFSDGPIGSNLTGVEFAAAQAFLAKR
jgi:hypothetical protein